MVKPKLLDRVRDAVQTGSPFSTSNRPSNGIGRVALCEAVLSPYVINQFGAIMTPKPKIYVAILAP